MSIPILDKLAYSVPSLAAATDLSVDTIQKQIKDGNLIASYPNSKPIVAKEEAERWLRSLPNEKP